MEEASIHVLLIEDNPGDARLMEEYLSEADVGCYSVTHAEDLKTGLEKLSSNRIDVVLLDVNLPDSTGLDTVRRCCQQACDVPVLVLNDFGDKQTAINAVQCGAQDFLEKGTFDPDLLARVIHYAIERQRMHTILQISEARFCKMIDENADGIVIVDRNGKALFANPAVLELFGCHKEELIGEDIGFPITNLHITKVDIPGYEKGERIAEIRVSETQWEGESAFLVSVRDVTEREQAAEQLRASHEMYQTLVDTSPDAVISVDTRLTIQYASARAVEWFGYQKEDVIFGRNTLEFIAPEDHERLIENARKLISEGISRNHQYKFVRRDKSQFTGEINVSLVKNSSGEPEIIIITLRDISEQLRAEELLRSLNEASLQIWAASTPDEVFQVAGKSFQNLGFTCIIFLLDKSGEKIYPAYLNFDSNSMKEVDKLVNLRAEDFRLNYKKVETYKEIFVKKTTILLDDVVGIAEQTIPHPFKGFAEKIVRLLMVPKAIIAPLIVDNLVVGMLSVQSEDLTEGDIPAMTAFANQLAAALKQAKLFEQAQREIAERKLAEQSLERRLKEITILNAMASFGEQEASEDELMRRALQTVSHYFQVANAGIWLFNEDQDAVILHRLHSGEIEKGTMLKDRIGRVITGKVLKTGKSVRLGDVSQDADYLAWNPGTCSEVCVPIKVGKRILGVINVESQQRDAFSQDDEKLLNMLGKQLAIAIDKVRLFEETRQKSDELAALYDIALAISEELDTSALLERLYEQINKILSPDIFGVILYDTRTDELCLEIVMEDGKPLQDWIGKCWSLDEGGLIGWVIQNRESLYIPDMREENATPVEPKQAGKPVLSWLGVPLFVHDQIIGSLTVQSFKRDAFDELNLNFIESLAGQVASALENARLYENELKRSQVLLALHEVDLAISSSLEPEQVYAAIVERSSQLLGCGIANLYLIDLVQQKYIRLASYGVQSGGIEDQSFVIKKSKIISEICESRSMIVIEDADTDERVMRKTIEKYGSRAILAIPLLYREEVTGCLFLLDIQKTRRWTNDETALANALASRAAIAIENARLYERTKQSALEFEELFDTASELAGQHDLSLILEAIMERATALLNISHGGIFLYNDKTNQLEFRIDKDLPIPRGSVLKIGEGLAGVVAESRQPKSIDNYIQWESRSQQYDHIRITSVLETPMLYAGNLIGVILVCEVEPEQRSFTENDVTLLSLFAAQAAAVVHSAYLFEETSQRVAELEVLNKISSALREVLSVAEMLPRILEHAVNILGARFGNIYLVEDTTGDLVAHCWYPDNPELLGMRNQFGEGITGFVAESGEIYITDDIMHDEKAKYDPVEEEFIDGSKSAITLPLETDRQVIGVMGMAMEHKHIFTEYEINLLTSISNIAANAIQRALLNEQTLSNLEKMTVMRDIDRAITANLDLKVTLELCLEQVINQLNVDAAVILQFNQSMKTLDYSTGMGFLTQEVVKLKVRLGEIYAGQAALERRTIAVKNIHQDENLVHVPKLFDKEEVVGYCVVPLIAKGEVKGVLEVFKRKELVYGVDWLEFLETIAEQAAIAIDNTSLFDRVQRTNLELVLAYNQTIEGWSKALELRHMESEGHSERVTSMTEKLARELRISDASIVHLQRGALLHDIGKMGIPDELMKKEGGLSEEEWNIIKKHPIDAYNLLSPISFLRPALEIPYYHHERWDGSGYPFGLEGERIPLAARIFAVVDVWDSLSTKRSYREAWPENLVMVYLRENSGKLFDPEVVSAFFRIMGVEPSELSFDQKSFEEMVRSFKPT